MSRGHGGRGRVTLKIGVVANSEDINAVGRPAGCSNGDGFEIDHLDQFITMIKMVEDFFND
jgi:hypothetical protein